MISATDDDLQESVKISKAFFWKCCTGRFVLATLCFVLANPYKFRAATPKQIRELMKVDGLTNDEVKSHLQVFTLLVEALLERNIVACPCLASGHFVWGGLCLDVLQELIHQGCLIHEGACQICDMSR